MRIGLFSDTYTPDINGVVSSIVTLQKELEKNGHEVFIITNHKALITTQRDGNVLRLPGLELKWLYGYKLSTPYHFSARDEIKKMNLDVIHVHTEFGVGMFGRIVGRYLNIPVVSTYHTMYEDYTHYINRFEIEEVEALGRKVVTTFSRKLSAHVQAVIAPSTKTKETLMSYGVKTPIYVIPTGLDLDKFEPERMDQEKVMQQRIACGLQPEDHVIVYVGRIAKEKSIDVQIEGFTHIKDPHIKLLIVGGGPQLEELKQLVENYGIVDRVIFTGAVSREEVPMYYAMGDAFVSASLTETQGMTYIEALASHLPVFARPDDVLRDLIIDEVNGFLFQTPQEFAKKVQSYLSLPKEEQDQMRKQARKAVVPYDGSMFYSKVMSVYYQAIDDYEDAYEVIKVKALEDRMRIYVINDKEDDPLKIFISLDDYFNLKIRKSTLLDRATVEELLHKEQLLLAYHGCIRKLRMRDYTTKEMQRYIRTNYNSISEKECDLMVEDLVKKGYLDDYQYMMSKIDKMQFSLQSKGKIIRTLVEKGISHDDIAEAVAKLDDEEERTKAIKIANKLKHSVKDKSLSMKRSVIAQKLIRQGFDSTIARNASEQIEFEDNDEHQELERVITKAYRTYHRKYQGNELINRIIRSCMQKGFHHTQIIEAMEEMEWYHEEMDQ